MLEENRQTEKQVRCEKCRGVLLAIEDDYGFTQPRTGPKAFTEYSFNALLVLVGLIGSFLATIGAASLYALFLEPLFSPLFSTLFGTTTISGILGICMIPFSISQVYYAWKIHSENFTGFSRIIAVSWVLIILSIASIVFMGFLAIFMMEIVGGQIFLNALVVFFLSKEEVQREFLWT